MAGRARRPRRRPSDLGDLDPARLTTVDEDPPAGETFGRPAHPDAEQVSVRRRRTEQDAGAGPGQLHVPAARLSHHGGRRAGRHHDAVVLVDEPGYQPQDRLEGRPDESLGVVDDERQVAVAAAERHELLDLVRPQPLHRPAAFRGDESTIP